MQPLVFSETENEKSGAGWVRAGRDIAYYQNNFKKVKATVRVNIPCRKI